MKSRVQILYMLIDVILIIGCLYIPYLLKYNHGVFCRLFQTGSKEAIFLPELGYHSLVFLFWGVLILLVFKIYGLYTTDRTIAYLDEAVLIAKALILAILPAAGAVFFFQVKIFSREVFIIQAVSLFIILAGWRTLKRYLVRRRVARGFNNQHVLIIGAGKVGRALAREIARNRYLGLEVVGFLDDQLTGEVDGHQILGPCGDFEEVVRREFVDDILISIPSERRLVARLILSARKLEKSIRVVPDLLSLGMEGIRAGHLGMIPLLEYYNKGLHGADLLLKRAFDIVVSALSLIVLTPLMLGIALSIKMDSPGPIFYISKRNGKKGKIFNFYKYRTMVKDADKMLEMLRHLDETDGPIFKVKNDPRISRVGRFLRRYSLDELPQLWNVLKGDMSLVGPRPPTPNEVEQYANWQLKRLEIRPGLTCLWQVRGRSNLSFREWMKLDLFYIENWSFWLDIKIILRTIWVVIRGEGAF
ncbi:MAG: sugar transferase [Candidatus Euphemobacter frigidus]|nr:sugar transferase [Candidatus Euphemobacter frigidus]MDP8276374.1 sugar transferase [Candidatus Euphemobacter frigidus]